MNPDRKIIIIAGPNSAARDGDGSSIRSGSRDLPSFRGLQPAQPARPTENALVSGHKTVALQRGRDDQTVGRVGMKIGKANGADSDLSIDGDFDHTLFQLLTTP